MTRVAHTQAQLERSRTYLKKVVTQHQKVVADMQAEVDQAKAQVAALKEKEGLSAKAKTKMVSPTKMKES